MHFAGAREIIYDVRWMNNSRERAGGRARSPIIDKKETGIHLRRIMDSKGMSVKDVQQYLRLGSVQSVYHWLNGRSYFA